MNKYVQAALDYAARGWPVFPCSTSKTPLVRGGVLSASTDADVIRAWWKQWPSANIAVDAGGAGFLVVDYDPGHDMAEVEKALGGKVPPTWLKSRTPRGGEHHFYMLGSREPLASMVEPFAAKVDTRSFHGYVLLPPSRTAAGEYQWISQGQIGPVTDALAEACRAARDKHPHRDDWIIEPDLPENVDAAVLWLREEARLAIEGNGGDNSTYATAAMMKSFGVSEPMALEILLAHWNDRCSPPWDPDELAAKVGNAYAYNTSPPGNCTRGYQAAKVSRLFTPVERPAGDGAEVTAGRFRFVDRAGMNIIQPPVWLVEDFIPAGGYGLLVGNRSSLKTFVALDVALTVATGGLPPWEEGEWRGPWKGLGKPGKVLFVAGESRSGILQRVRAWESFHFQGRWAENFVLGDPVPRILDGSDVLDKFIEGALRLAPDGYDLVVLDTISRAMAGANENSQEDTSAFNAMVEHIQREMGAAVLGIHHTGRGDQTRARGSTVLEADADMMVIVDRPSDEGKKIKLTMGPPSGPGKPHKDAPGWEKPVWLEAHKVALPLEQTSLALTRAKLKEHEEEREKAREGHRRQMTLGVVDRRVVEVLKAHPNKEYTWNSLARATAAWRPETGPGEQGDTLGLTAQTICKVWLERLVSEQSDAREWYDGEKDRWRYRPARGGKTE